MRATSKAAAAAACWARAEGEWGRPRDKGGMGIREGEFRSKGDEGAGKDGGLDGRKQTRLVDFGVCADFVLGATTSVAVVSTGVGGRASAMSSSSRERNSPKFGSVRTASNAHDNVLDCKAWLASRTPLREDGLGCGIVSVESRRSNGLGSSASAARTESSASKFVVGVISGDGAGV